MPSCLSVFTFNNIPINKLPLAFAFGLVVIKGPNKLRAIWVFPFTSCNLSKFPFPNWFHSCLKEYISALAMFLSLFPVTWINVLILIGHNTLTVSLTVGPVTVVRAYSCINHFSNAIFEVIFPSTRVSVLLNILSISSSWSLCISVDTIISMS